MWDPVFIPIQAHHSYCPIVNEVECYEVKSKMEF